MYKKVLILLFFIPFQLLFAQTSMLKDFPEGLYSEEIGKRLIISFSDRETCASCRKMDWLSGDFLLERGFTVCLSCKR